MKQATQAHRALSDAKVLPLGEGLLNEQEVARLLGLSVRFLQTDRVSRRHGVPYLKLGSAVRYRASEVATWLEKHAVRTCSEAEPA